MASNLDFLNKNLFRKYPFKASASLVSTSGLDLPLDLVAAMSISTTLDLSDLYVSQVVIKNGFISITVQAQNDVAIGCFYGLITSDFQTLTLSPFVPFVSGFLITGNYQNILTYFGLFSFNYTDSVLEPTTVFCYTPPAVTSLITGQQTIQGNIDFGTLINLQLTTSALPDNYFQLKVIDTITVQSLADFSSQFRNCPTPFITSINTAIPYTPDVTSANDNNIYLFGVDPISFDPVQLTSSPNTFGINITTPGLDLSTLCANTPLLPPLVPNFLINREADSFVGIQRYYTKSQTPIENFLQNTLPEYTLWPNFVLTYATTIVNPSNGTTVIFDPGSQTPILASDQSATIREIAVQTSTGTLTSTFNIVNSPTTTNIIPSFKVTAEGVIVQPTSDSTFLPTSKFSMDLSSVSGAMVVTIIVFYNLVVS